MTNYSWIMKVKVCLFYLDLEWADKLADNIVKEVGEDKVERKKITKITRDIVFKDGSRIMIRPANKMYRKIKCDRALFQDGVTEKFYNMLKPTAEGSRAYITKG